MPKFEITLSEYSKLPVTIFKNNDPKTVLLQGTPDEIEMSFRGLEVGALQRIANSLEQLLKLEQEQYRDFQDYLAKREKLLAERSED